MTNMFTGLTFHARGRTVFATATGAARPLGFRLLTVELDDPDAVAAMIAVVLTTTGATTPPDNTGPAQDNARLREALQECQQALAMLINRGSEWISGARIQSRWASVVAAEATARSALADTTREAH